MPVIDDAAAPQSTIMDETHKVAITRLGDRIRVAGQAEIIGYNNKLGKHATDSVRHVIRDLFPKGGDISRAEGWTGLRPMTPDGTPVMGATRYPNLFLNTGHGTLGWTMACGSGRGGGRSGSSGRSRKFPSMASPRRVTHGEQNSELLVTDLPIVEDVAEKTKQQLCRQKRGGTAGIVVRRDLY